MGKNEVSCIIDGIIDPVVASGARLGQFSIPEHLLSYPIQHNTPSTATPSSTSKGRPTCHRCNKPRLVARYCRVNVRKTPANTKKGKDAKLLVTCHKCGKAGHYANACTSTKSKPLKCNSCQCLGHDEANCHTKPWQTTEKVNQLESLSISPNQKLYKTVFVKGQSLKAYIDFGSICMTIRADTVTQLDLTIDQSESVTHTRYGRGQTKC